MSEENPVINITTDDAPPKGKRVHKPGYIEKLPERVDPQIQRRADFEEVTLDAERHQQALEASRSATTRSSRYVSILFTPQQIAYMKAKFSLDKAAIAEDILVKLDSAS